MSKSCACKFLYGSDTDPDEMQKVEDAVENQTELKTNVLFYRKTGTPFWCLLDIVPIKNEKGEVVLFLASHKDITKEKTGKLSITEDTADNQINDMRSELKLDLKRSGSDESVGSQDSEGSPEEPSDAYKYQRRRSRAVLYHLSGTFDKQKNTKSKLQLNKFKNLSGNQSLPEYKVQEIKRSRFILLHYGIFKIGWDWLILLCTFYIAIIVPYNAAFVEPADNERASIVTDVIVEMLFIIDIVLNFRTTFVSKSGQVVYESKLIAINYFRGWFLLDLLAAIPFDLLYAFQVNTGTLIHLLKVARLLRLARLMQKLDRYSQYSFIVLTLLMAVFTVLAHWLACIWYFIGKEELSRSPGNWTVGWLYQLSEKLDNPIVRINETFYNKPSSSSSYISALYFTCTSLTSVGFGNVSANTNAEKIFCIIAMLIGALMHALVFGNVTAIIQRMYARRAIYHAKTKDLKDFFRTHHIPKPLKTRMQEYFQTMWSLNSGIDPSEVMRDFPEELQGDIAMHLHREILALPVFDNASHGCLKTIAMQIKSMFCAPGEFLIHKGDAIAYVYFVVNGSMEILKNGMVVAILGKGDLFGSDLGFTENIVKSTCDVKSLTYCDLQCIQLKGLMETLSMYPEVAEKFSQDIQHDLTYNLREGYEEPEESDMNGGPSMTLPSISEDDEEDLEEENEKDAEKMLLSPGTNSPPMTRHTLSPGDNGASAVQRVMRICRSERFPLRSERSFPFAHPQAVSRSLEKAYISFGVPLERPSRFLDNQAEDFLVRRRRSFEMKRGNFSRGRRSFLSNLDSSLRPAHTAPQLSLAPVRKKVDSDESLTPSPNETSLQMELEQTRNVVEHLDKQVMNLSQEVATIRTDIKTILRLLHSPPTTPSGSHQGSPESPPRPHSYSFSTCVPYRGKLHNRGHRDSISSAPGGSTGISLVGILKGSSSPGVSGGSTPSGCNRVDFVNNSQSDTVSMMDKSPDCDWHLGSDERTTQSVNFPSQIEGETAASEAMVQKVSSDDSGMESPNAWTKGGSKSSLPLCPSTSTPTSDAGQTAAGTILHLTDMDSPLRSPPHSQDLVDLSSNCQSPRAFLSTDL